YSEGETVQTEIFGSKGGVLRGSGPSPKLFSRVSGAYTTTIPKLDETPTSAQAEFIRAVSSGKPPIVTPEQGVAVTRIIDGIYRG
ncbi:MAG: hypothetical protein WCL39_10800, partial [Armatimonadota bacterium]